MCDIIMATYGINMGNNANVADCLDLCIVSRVGVEPLKLWETSESERRSRLYHRG